MKHDHLKIQKLFDAAVDLPQADCDLFLDKECGDDDALLAEVESLLEHNLSQPTTKKQRIIL